MRIKGQLGSRHERSANLDVIAADLASACLALVIPNLVKDSQVWLRPYSL